MEGLDALVEGLDDSFWDAVPSPAASPVKPKPPPRSVSDADSATRCTVDSVSDSHLNGRWCKVLHAHVSKDHSSPRTIYLFDDWYETPVHPGDTINVLGAFSSTSPPSIEITSQSNLVILHPDILLTATSLSNAPQCPRKPLLSSLVRASNDTSPALVWGNMLHELIQRCLLHPDPQLAFSPSFINGQIDSIIVSSLGSLVVLDISEETARATLRDRARALSSFASRYIGSTPKPEATLSDTRSTSSSKTNLLAISRIHEVEEDIWSPKYGLKGKLDVTVEAVITESSSPPGRPGMAGKPGFFGKGTLPSMLGNGIGPTTSGPRPFEIKTGRSMGGMEHRAQTMLYTLLASERYGVEVDKGLLFYTQKDTGEIVQVPRGRNEIRGLLIMRNELANWMMVRMRDSATDPAQLPAPDDSMQVDTDIACGTAEPDLEEAFLPPPIDSDHTCKRCYVLDACTLYRFALSTPSPSSTSSKSLIPTPTFKALESPPPSSTHSTLSTTYAMKTSHLNPSHALFFRTWERLLSLEEKDLVRYKSELWRVGAVEREKRGRCLSGMVMKQDLKHPNSGATSTSQSATVGELDLHSENDANQVTGSRIHKFTYTFTRAKSFVFPSSQPSSQFFPFSTSQPSSQPASQHPSQTPPPTLLHTHLSPGDAITISIEPYLLALVQGYILSLTADEITVGVDHVLDLDALKERVNVLKARRGGSPSTRSTPASWNLDPFSSQVRLNTNGETNGDEEELIFRIDKDELFGGMSRMRNNLAQLFYVEGDHKRRSLIVDLREPVFGPVPVIPGLPFPSTSSTSSSPPPPSPPSPPSPPTPPSTAASIQQATSTLNPTQLSALHKVLSAQDYALILGMPGTGKTTVIAALIRVLVALGKTVLLASYTHSAVDSILRKLSESEEDEEKGQVTEEGKGRANEKRKNSGFWDVKVLRLGNIDKVHPDARRYTLEARPKAQTVAGLEKQWLSPPVVASTCLGVDHPIFTKRKFDYCIVDEASQITLPTCLGPLRHADKFVLVGDHFQLPPLVKNPQARTGGLDVSLFRLLSSAHPQSVTDLTHQYRMNASIMLLSNKLIYDDRLKCGSESVAGRRLELPDGGMAVRRMHRRLGRMRRVQGLGEPGDDRLCNGKNENGCWLSKLLDPSTKAIFVDTSTLGSVAYDSRVGDLVQNTTEASLVVQFVEALVKSGVRQDQVGVISLYRQQVKLLGEKLKNVRGSGHEGGVGTGGGLDGVEVLTADKSQGRDKDCIVVSLVRSNPENQIGELVRDWRRMNVSFTRARSKLVIFGSRSTLQSDALLSQFFELMEGQGWVYALQEGAERCHGDLPWDGNAQDTEAEVEEEELEDPVDEVVSTGEPDVGDHTVVVDDELEPAKKPSPRKRPAQAMEDDDNEVVVVDAKPRSSPTIIDVDLEDDVEVVLSTKMDVDDDDEIEVFDGPTHRRAGSSSLSPRSTSRVSSGTSTPSTLVGSSGISTPCTLVASSSDHTLSSSASASSAESTPSTSKGSRSTNGLPSVFKGGKKGKEKENRVVSMPVSSASSKDASTKTKSTSTGSKTSSTKNTPSSSSSKTASTINPSAPRTTQSKLDGWFKRGAAGSTSSSAKPSTSTNQDESTERPKKMPRIRGVASDPSITETSTMPSSKARSSKKSTNEEKKLTGLLKGRPILQDLVKNET